MSVTAAEFGAAFGPYLGIPVVEVPGLQRGSILYSDRLILVRDAWEDMRLPLMIADMRKAMRAHLAELVTAAEQRLGLDRP